MTSNTSIPGADPGVPRAPHHPAQTTLLFESGAVVTVTVSNWPGVGGSEVWIEVTGSVGLGSALAFAESAEARQLAEALTACAEAIDHGGATRGGR